MIWCGLDWTLHGEAKRTVWTLQTPYVLRHQCVEYLTCRESLESSNSSGSLPDLAAFPPNPNRRGTLPIMEGEKKQIELQNRVYRARLIIPMHIPFRVFEDPTECVEAEEIVKRLVFLS